MEQEDFYEGEEGDEGDEDFGNDSFRDEDEGEEEHEPEEGQFESRHEELAEQAETSRHVDHYREEDRHSVHDGDASKEDLDESFEKDVDLHSKVKANLLVLINEHRAGLGLGPLFEDITLDQVSSEYGVYLKNNEHNPKHLKDLLEYSRVDMTNQPNPPNMAYVVSKYDEDVKVTSDVSQSYFVEIGHLFFEIDQYRKYLEDPNVNHIGIGLAGSSKLVVIVFFFTFRALCISSITYSPENAHRVEVRGKVFDSTVGVFVMKVLNGSMPPDSKAMIMQVLPSKMTYNKATKEYSIFFEMANPFQIRNYIEIYTRANPDTISYGKPNEPKVEYRVLDMKMRSILVEFPQASFTKALNDLLERRQQEIKHHEEQVQDQRESEHILEPQQQVEEQQQEEEELLRPEEEVEARDQTVTNKEIREQLEMAISEANRQLAQERQRNEMYVDRIKALKMKPPDMFVERGGEMAMNEHKYLNMLTQVHQTWMELKQTTDKYEKMWSDLDEKMKEKKQKCKEIRIAFNELKREVARKAAYSRTDKPIEEPKIQAWEDEIQRLNKDLESHRLQILKFRNSLAKNNKILKKKEELAQGLHLIDFEQLKIENQNLNEKIEERNEDLTKLGKKTTTTVQILAHTREKYNYTCKLYAEKKKVLNAKQDSYKATKEKLRDLKIACEEEREHLKAFKQDTQIVNSQELVEDYRKRTKHITELTQKIKELRAREAEMKEVIEAYQRKVKKESLQK